MSIRVLDLAGEKKVVISATKDGTAVLDPVSGKELQVAESKKAGVDITEPGNMVSVVAGKGMTEPRRINQDEVREIVGETSDLPPARHDLNQRADGATFTIQPSMEKPAEAR